MGVRRRLPAEQARLARDETHICLDLEAILGAPVLLADEDVGAYYRLRELIRQTIEPTDTIEALWVRDITDLTWEGVRYRRWKSAYHRFAYTGGAAKIYQEANGHTHEAIGFIQALASGSARAKSQMDRTMKEAGYDQDVLAAAAFCASRSQFEFLEQMVAEVEGRRDGAIQKVERRREAIARRLQSIVRNVEDAEILEDGTPAAHPEASPPTPRRRRIIPKPVSSSAAPSNAVNEDHLEDGDAEQRNEDEG